MNTSTYLRWFSRMLVLGAVVAGTAGPAVAAVGRPPDVRDAATTNATVPDVFERYATAHPYGSGLSTPDLRPPDVQDTAAAIAGPSPVDRIVAQERGRHRDLGVLGSSPSTTDVSAPAVPPDVRDAADAAAAAALPTAHGDGFDWADYGIGIGSGIGLSLVLAAGLGAALQRRGRMQTA